MALTAQTTLLNLACNVSEESADGVDPDEGSERDKMVV